MEGKYPNFSAVPTAPPTFEEAMNEKGSKYPPEQTVTPAFAPSPYSTPAPSIPQPGPAMAIAPVLGPDPATVTCPHCRNTVTTFTETVTNSAAHLICLGLFIIGCWPCCCIPYCMDSMQTTLHSCPSCRNFLGSYKP